MASSEQAVATGRQGKTLETARDVAEKSSFREAGCGCTQRVASTTVAVQIGGVFDVDLSEGARLTEGGVTDALLLSLRTAPGGPSGINANARWRTAAAIMDRYGALLALLKKTITMNSLLRS